MSTFRLSLKAIQHIDELTLELDLSKSGLFCLVGRNGAGKTTLLRAMRNLSNADTFVRTATPRAFCQHSQIIYRVGQIKIEFNYDENIRSLNCKSEIPDPLRSLISAELPIPHGARFNYFKTASEADSEIRKAVALGNYIVPDELISLMNSIYQTDRYSRLSEFKYRGKSFFALIRGDGTYIREDYLSSGEYFLINLYRTIKGPHKLIAIDEIDISLDAAAQARIADELRKFCTTYERTILFTTHSLALLKQLNADELHYLDNSGPRVRISPVSYSHAKARLFGFTGWDRYILTEDQVLSEFLQEIIEGNCGRVFFRYKIISVGGGSQVSSFLRDNATHGFLASPERVIAVLDGDQRATPHASTPGVHVIPLESVEKALYQLRETDPDFPFATSRTAFNGDKDFFKHLERAHVASRKEIYAYLIRVYEAELGPLVTTLSTFLTEIQPVRESGRPPSE